MVRENPEDSLVKYGDTKCPACGSVDVTVDKVHLPGVDATKSLGTCLTCNHLWSEDCADEGGK
jgi:DNA-directed RNA polymerase subunit M/transcription elongation factor TFIIS